MIDIEATDVSARTEATRGVPSSVLRRATFRWREGLLAFLGTPADGTSALLGALAGDVALRGGSVTIGGLRPDAARARMAFVPASPLLPHGSTVAELWAITRRARGGERDAEAALDVLGVARIAPRRATSLDVGEARAMLLAFALASPTVDVLLVEEPLAMLEPKALGRVEAALRARASTSVVLASTSSVRDAARLADEVLLVTQGQTASVPPGWLHTAREGVRLTVVVPGGGGAPSPAETFARALEERGEITVERAAYGSGDGGDGDVLVLRGPDLVPVARAVAEAARASGTSIRAMEPDVLSLSQVQAAAHLASGEP